MVQSPAISVHVAVIFFIITRPVTAALFIVVPVTARLLFQGSQKVGTNGAFLEIH